MADIYGVTTKRLNEQEKLNRDRFPEDFMLQLTEKKKAEVVTNCDRLKKLKYSPVLPNVFTGHRKANNSMIGTKSMTTKKRQ